MAGTPENRLERKIEDSQGKLAKPLRYMAYNEKSPSVGRGFDQVFAQRCFARLPAAVASTSSTVDPIRAASVVATSSTASGGYDG